MTRYTNKATDEILRALRELVGIPGLLSEPADIAPYCTDWRREFGAAALAVARPKTTEQVAAIVRYCADRKIAIVPQGGNTSLAGGAVPIPERAQIILNMSRMDVIRCIDVVGMTVAVEAGVVIAQLQEAVREQGLLFPVSFAAEGSSQVGGAISTNAGGINVLRYGMMRQRVLGLEAVLPNGSIVNGLHQLHKDNAGYDWKQLLIGAEGTLGVVTGATLRLAPIPKHKVTALLAVQDPCSALALFKNASIELGDAIAAFELISPVAIDLVKQHFGRTAPIPAGSWAVLIEATASLSGLRDGMESMLAAALEAGHVTDGVIAESVAQASELWALREHISEAEQRAGTSVKHDVSVPISRVASFIRHATDSVTRMFGEPRVVVFGHVGDGNVHFNILVTDPMTKTAINRVVHDIAISYGGSISAEHGIGTYRVEELARYKQFAQLNLMRTIKTTIDPYCIFNPGKVLDISQN